MKLNWQEHHYRDLGQPYTVFTARLGNGRWDAELVFPGGSFTAGHDGHGFDSEDEACRWGRDLAASYLTGQPVMNPAPQGSASQPR